MILHTVAMKVSKLNECRRHYSSFLLLGPRLEESLSVMNIPRKRRNDLAIHLCGKLESIFLKIILHFFGVRRLYHGQLL